MHDLFAWQSILSLLLMALGGFLAIANAWVLSLQCRNKDGPSMAPFVGGILLFAGGLLYPGGALRPWAVVGLLLDVGCLPYFLSVSLHLLDEKERYAKRNIRLSLSYTTPRMTGALVFYPEDVCLHRWQSKDGVSKGSMVMTTTTFSPNECLEVTLGAVHIAFAKQEGRWVVTEDGGWHDPNHSLRPSDVTEEVAEVSAR